MLSSFSKSGLTVNILNWETFTNSKGQLDSLLIAEVLYNSEKRIDTISGDMLTYLLSVSDKLGFKSSNFDVQNNIPSLHYAEAYYDLIV
jgi:hypothetical protein